MAEYDNGRKCTSEYDCGDTNEGACRKTDDFKLYAYGKDGKLAEVPEDLWKIQTEDGKTPEKLSEDTLYEVHVTVEDGGSLDLSDTEKEIKIAVVLGN